MKRHCLNLLLLHVLTSLAQGQINITGLTDQSVYSDQVTFIIETAWFGNDWVLHWQDPSFLLETANHPTGPWTPMNTTAPVAVMVKTAQQFFRLKQP